jgi:hypothetical protein
LLLPSKNTQHTTQQLTDDFADGPDWHQNISADYEVSSCRC